MDFAKSVGRKVGMFGGREAADAELAAKVAAEARAAAEAATAQAADAAAVAYAQNSAIATDIQAAILSYVPLEAIQVWFDGNLATIAGTAASQSDKEKAVLIAGNTEHVGQVDGDRVAVVVAELPARYHTVVAGDTLSKISLAQYGVIHLFDAIFVANQPMLTHPDKIYPGQVLRIPPVAAPSHTVAKGETLGAIAKHWFGDAGQYTKIFEANRDQLSSADAIAVGQVLRIPIA